MSPFQPRSRGSAFGRCEILHLLSYSLTKGSNSAGILPSLSGLNQFVSKTTLLFGLPGSGAPLSLLFLPPEPIGFSLLPVSFYGSRDNHEAAKNFVEFVFKTRATRIIPVLSGSYREVLVDLKAQIACGDPLVTRMEQKF